LKDGKYLLVVQYIRHGPFRPSMFGALKGQQSQQRATGNNGGIDRSPRDSNDQSPRVDQSTFVGNSDYRYQDDFPGVIPD
jgi:hypothetical protein